MMGHFMRLLVVVVFFLGFFCNGEDKVNYPVHLSISLPGDESPSFLRVSVDGGEFLGIPDMDGHVSLSLPAGSHHLEVYSVNHVFEAVRLEISAKEQGRVRAFTGKGERLPTPLVLVPSEPAVYVKTVQPFPLFGLLKNPMVLMVGMTVFMSFVLPALTSSLQEQEHDQVVPADKKQN